MVIQVRGVLRGVRAEVHHIAARWRAEPGAEESEAVKMLSRPEKLRNEFTCHEVHSAVIGKYISALQCIHTCYCFKNLLLMRSEIRHKLRVRTEIKCDSQRQNKQRSAIRHSRSKTSGGRKSDTAALSFKKAHATSFTEIKNRKIICQFYSGHHKFPLFSLSSILALEPSESSATFFA